MRGRRGSDGAGVAEPGRAGGATAAAYGVACLVHLATVGLLISGLLLIVLGFTTVVQPLIGLVLLALAAQLRPRFAGLASDLPTLRRGEAPALFTLLDAIADEAGVRRVDAVRIGADFDVRVSTFGIRRRRLLELGFPLWLTSAPQQRVAAVAHALELASRDVRRGALVGLALSSLNGGSELAEHRPDPANGALTAPATSRHADEMAAAARRFRTRGRIVNLVLWIPQLVTKGAARLLLRLTLPGARRAEFQADAVAARIASTPAALSLLSDRRLARTVGAEVRRLAIATRTFGRAAAVRSAEQDFWPRVATHVAALPDRARDRPDDVGRDVATVTDSGSSDHPAGDRGLPSDGPRIARLSLGAVHPATITLDATVADAIEDELREPRQLLARKVIQDGGLAGAG